MVLLRERKSRLVGYIEPCLPSPANLSDIEAASLPETFFTVWSNVFDRGHLLPGETLLVQIAAKSMLLNVKTGHRIVDDCISPKQRELNEAAKAAKAASASS